MALRKLALVLALVDATSPALAQTAGGEGLGLLEGDSVGIAGSGGLALAIGGALLVVVAIAGGGSSSTTSTTSTTSTN